MPYDRRRSCAGLAVVQWQLDVLEHAQQLALLIRGIAQRLSRQVVTGRYGTGLADPAEEALHQRAYVLLAKRLPLGDRRSTGSLVGSVDRTNTQEPLQPHRIPADRGLEEVLPTVRPTTDEHHAVLVVLWWPAFQDVVGDVIGQDSASVQRTRVGAEWAEEDEGLLSWRSWRPMQ